MSDKKKAQDQFSTFMKKQIESKKKDAEIKSTTKKKPVKSKGKLDKKAKNKKDQDGLEEELLDAKRESRSKASRINQAEMFKRMFVENTITFVTIIVIMLIMIVAVIKFGSAFLEMMHGFVLKALKGALNVKN